MPYLGYKLQDWVTAGLVAVNVQLSLSFLKKNNFIYFFMFGCTRCSVLHMGFLLLWRKGVLFVAVHGLLSWGLLMLQSTGSVSCGAQWLPGLVAPRHVESSRTRDGTHFLCIGRQILMQCATREVLLSFLSLQLMAEVQIIAYFCWYNGFTLMKLLAFKICGF